MIRISSYLDQDTHTLLTNYAKENNCSISHATSKIISSHLMGEDSARDSRAENKEHFLRLMNVLNQVFMCVYDTEKVSIESSSAEGCLAEIKQMIRAHSKTIS